MLLSLRMLASRRTTQHFDYRHDRRRLGSHAVLLDKNIYIQHYASSNHNLPSVAWHSVILDNA
jgi:hypothetical protein